MVDYTSNNVTHFYGTESAFGVVDTTTQATPIRFNSGSLKPNAEFTRSEEVNAEGMTVDTLKTKSGAGGSLGGELVFSEFDSLIQYGIQSATAPSGTLSSTGTSIGASNVLTDVSEITSAWAIGMWVRVTNATVSTENGYYRISAQSGNTITVTGAVMTSGGTCDLDLLNQMKNGNTLQYLTLGKFLNESTDVYVQYPGTLITGVHFEGTRGGLINVSFDFISKNENSQGATNWTSGGIALVGANPPLSSVADFARVVEGTSVTTSIDVISYKIDIVRAIRDRTVMGTEGAVGMGNGSMVVTGAYEKYFATRTLMDKFLNNTPSEFGVMHEDENNDAVGMDLPRIRYTDANEAVPGKDTDILLNVEFEGVRHAGSSSAFSFNTLT
jgi:Phage tail tube protein